MLKMKPFWDRITECLEQQDIHIDGSKPWDIKIHDKAFYRRLFSDGSLGLGESYMDGWWDCERLDEFFYRVLWAGLDEMVGSWRAAFEHLKARLLNLQTPRRSMTVGKRHYDIGNDLYSRMLDRYMIYSCGYWRDARTLDEAQEAKLDLAFRKLGLEQGMKLLDIGCGWGGTARFAAERYGVHVTGVTISREQAKLAGAICEDLPVDIRLMDYRDLEGAFDRIVSIGMFEHVGYKNYRPFMTKVRELLADDGLFLLQTIGGNESVQGNEPWISKYIFPNSMLPSAAQITEMAEGRMVMEDWHNFGADYEKTLMAWYHNFVAHWPELNGRYDERFFRMWSYYLLSCAGSFRARRNQLWQIVFSPNGVKNGYRAAR